MRKLTVTARNKLLKNIRLCVFDVDGVLTNGILSIDQHGNETKHFHVRDGQGLVSLIQANISVGIISARPSKAVEIRMKQMGIEHVCLGVTHKKTALEQLTKQLGYQLNQVTYLGDDTVDLAPMRIVGLPIAVQDAHPSVKKAALWVTHANGGHGAAREVCDATLLAKEESAQ